MQVWDADIGDSRAFIPDVCPLASGVFRVENLTGGAEGAAPKP